MKTLGFTRFARSTQATLQRGAMQCSPRGAVRAGFPRRRNQLRKQSRPLAAELLNPLFFIHKQSLANVMNVSYTNVRNVK